MMKIVRNYRWRLVGTVLLIALAVSLWLVVRWLTPEPGSSEDLFARIQVGMSQNQAVAVLRSYPPDNTEGRYCTGTAKDGRSLDWYCPDVNHFFDNLPLPQEIEHCVLSVLDGGGREVEVILGPGGIVTGKRLSPGVVEDRLEQVNRALLSWDVWEERFHKFLRSFRRHPYLWFGVATAFLMLSVWKLLRGILRKKTRTSTATRMDSVKPAADLPRAA
jgi:hypothetical protein